MAKVPVRVEILDQVLIPHILRAFIGPTPSLIPIIHQTLRQFLRKVFECAIDTLKWRLRTKQMLQALLGGVSVLEAIVLTVLVNAEILTSEGLLL